MTQRTDDDVARIEGGAMEDQAMASKRVREWSPRQKTLASVLIAFHLFAVFAAPCASPPPASYAWNWIAGRVDGVDGLLMPYLRATYLNHGYRFFAPNPGASHLVRYEIDLAKGGAIEGRFPDPEEHWPRLMYHRFFMISETIFNLAEPVSESPSPVRPFPPLLQIDSRDDLSESEQHEFAKQKAAAEELANSIARQLLKENDGSRIRLFLQTHEIPPPNAILDGTPLDDPQFFTERFLGDFTVEQL